MMKYISTRGQAPELSFEEVVLAGLATDGGLYVPKTIPRIEPSTMVEWAGLPYTELAMRVMQPFMGNAIPEKDLRELVEGAYSEFRHPAIAPLVQIGHDRFILELFHGPTLAFKDFALQFLGRTLSYFLARRKEHVTVVGATSGDTGSAAIAGCRGRGNMDIFIFHPEGRVSDVQRRQMTTVTDENVHNVALKGTFDDCQDLVKALFADAKFRDETRLVAVNSINWARILAQVVYYFYAALALGAPAREVSFSVPTGNFGDIFAGFIAKKMGLPIGELMIATNRNNILTRCLQTGEYKMDGVEASLSPSMDIQISSNFERLLFDLHGQDSAKVAGLMQQLRDDKSFTLGEGELARLRGTFGSASADDTLTKETIRNLYATTGYLADPHTAVGIAASSACRGNSPVVILSTAHPAKFPDAVKAACGMVPELPIYMRGIMERPERCTVMEMGDMGKIQDFIRARQGQPA